MRWLERTAIILAAVAIISLAFVSVASAQPIGVNNISQANSSRFDTSAITPIGVNAQAGNVSQLEINTTTVTTSWQGFYGNVTGKIILADSVGNNLYDWNITSPAGEIYASRSNSITWTNVNCSNTTHIATEEAYLQQSPTDPDSVTSTFASTNHPGFDTNNRPMTTCPATKAYDSTGEQGTDYWQVLLNDFSGGQNVIYTTILEPSATTGFDGRDWQFGLLVGEVGKGANSTILTPYYFYVELT